MKRVLSFLICAFIFTSLLSGFTGDTFISSRGQNDPFVIVLDPGHGGSDPGAVYKDAEGNSFNEKTFNYKIALYAKEYLEQHKNVIVYLTRYDDNYTYLGLGPRVDFALENNADVLLSLHNNASSNTSASGTVIYVPSGNYQKEVARESKELADMILKNIEKLGMQNRGFQTRTYTEEDRIYYPDGSLSDYYGIIRRSTLYSLPSMIIEHAFMSNLNDLEVLKDDEMLKAFGKASADAVAQYYGLVKLSDGEQPLQPKTYKTQNTPVRITPGASTMTFGDPDFQLFATGGSGNGEYSFAGDSLRVLEFDGNMATIIGAGTIVLRATKNSDGEYGPLTSGNSYSLTVKKREISFDISLTPTGSDGSHKIICKATNYVDWKIPEGNVEIYVDGKLLKASTLNENGLIELNTQLERGTTTIRVLYSQRSYDCYSSSGKQINYDYMPYSPSPSPSATPVPTKVPTATPTSAPTQTPEAATPTPSEGTYTPSVLETATPESGFTNPPGSPSNEEATPTASSDKGSSIWDGSLKYLIIILLPVLVIGTWIFILTGNKQRR